MPKYLSLDDSKKLLEAADNQDNRNYKRDYAITILFLNCGMRLSELVGININDIDFEDYYARGYRGVIFDIDNTLVRHDMPADKRAKQLFWRLKKIGFQFCFTSNNKEPRVKKFCQDVGGQ